MYKKIKQFSIIGSFLISVCHGHTEGILTKNSSNNFPTAIDQIEKRSGLHQEMYDWVQKEPENYTSAKSHLKKGITAGLIAASMPFVFRSIMGAGLNECEFLIKPRPSLSGLPLATPTVFTYFGINAGIGIYALKHLGHSFIHFLSKK